MELRGYGGDVHANFFRYIPHAHSIIQHRKSLCAVPLSLSAGRRSVSVSAHQHVVLWGNFPYPHFLRQSRFILGVVPTNNHKVEAIWPSLSAKVTALAGFWIACEPNIPSRTIDNDVVDRKAPYAFPFCFRVRSPSNRSSSRRI